MSDVLEKARALAYDLAGVTERRNEAQAARDDAIRAAFHAGHSLREVARATGLSVATVVRVRDAGKENQ